MRKLQVGILGAGTFGRHHAGKVAGSPYAELIGIYDKDRLRAEALAKRQKTQMASSLQTLLLQSDAIIIATPAHTHLEFARGALADDCHLLVEKPLALSSEEALSLANLAETKGLVLQVGHQERLVARDLGLLSLPTKPKHIKAIRSGPFPGIERVGGISVIWDLMIHDLDLTAQILNEELRVLSVEAASVHTTHADEATVHLTSETGRTIHLDASRTQTEATRTLKLIYDEGTILVDFIARRIRYTGSTDFHKLSPNFPSDPLGLADEAFFQSCLGSGASPIPARSVLAAVNLAEAIHLKL